jgi:hypothetical protein
MSSIYEDYAESFFSSVFLGNTLASITWGFLFLLAMFIDNGNLFEIFPAVFLYFILSYFVSLCFAIPSAITVAPLLTLIFRRIGWIRKGKTFALCGGLIAFIGMFFLFNWLAAHALIHGLFMSWCWWKHLPEEWKNSSTI